MADPDFNTGLAHEQGGNVLRVKSGASIVSDLGGSIIFSAVDALVAFAGGGQANATPLTGLLNRVTTVATIADSLLLPPAVPGLSVTVSNAAANSANIFPNGATDVINALAVQTAIALAGGKTIEFVCMKAGQWHTLLSA